MKRRYLNKYTVAAFLFIATAVVLVAIPFNSYLSEFITAACMIAGMACAMTGIFILMFSGGEPFDPHLVAILPSQGCMNVCRLAFDLGIHGKAHFLPPRVTGEDRVMQFNPTQSYQGSQVSVQESFPSTGPSGLVIIPSCYPLIQRLRKGHALVIPNTEEHLTQLLRETISGIGEFAQKVSVYWQRGSVTITLHQYRLIDGCQFIAQESPGCCTRNPCPVCSLCAALISEGMGRIIAVDQCSVNESKKDVIIVFSLLMPIDPPSQLPKDEGSGSLH